MDGVDRFISILRLPSYRSSYSRRISYYLGRFLPVIDATICVSEKPSEMTNVAISIARKLYVSMYLDPRYNSVPLFLHFLELLRCTNPSLRRPERVSKIL